ncbi:MAG: MFS transporter [Sphingomonas sp.]|nr:MFS transporter [Sphingomonas sp.]
MPGLIYPLPEAPEVGDAEARKAPSTGPGPWSIALYRSLWLATTFSNVGTCMKDVGAGWLMTSLSASPLLVALVQSAAMLPMALLSLPAGALADIVSRRKLLIAAQAWALGASLILFFVTLAGSMDPALLLLLTFATACGSAFSIPALQSVTTEIVPRAALTRAVSLGGVSNNIARILGPAAGGLVIAAAGAEWVFLANGLSILGIIAVIRRWEHVPQPARFPPEHLLGAIRAGFRYVHSSGGLHSLMVRCIVFFTGASALWSLLPLLARHQLGLGPAGYGLLLTFIGAGAITAALMYHQLRLFLSADAMTRGASLLLAGALAVAGLATIPSAALVAMFAAGFGWNLMTSSFQSTALLDAAPWVKARAFGIFLMVFNASMALGAFLWGTVATLLGLQESMLLASGLLALGLVASLRYRLVFDPDQDFSPSRHWPDPATEIQPAADDGPVLVTIEYEVSPANDELFVKRLGRLRALRLRDGAMRWRYWRDVSRRNLVIETFIVDSWLEHMRQHDRVTKADRLLQEEVNALHSGKSPPRVRHWIALR